jgi:hypothetical protein
MRSPVAGQSWPLFRAVVIRPNIGTPLAARLAVELRLDIRKPNIIGPTVGGAGS